MAQGLTLQQLQSMGAKPVMDTPKQGFTATQLQGMSAQTPSVTSQNAPQSMEQPNVVADATTGIVNAAKENLYDPFASRIKGVIERAPNQNIASTVLQGAGSLVGGAMDVFGKGLGGAIKAVTPEPIQQKVSKVAGDVSQGVSNAISPEVKAKLAKIVEEHPEAAANINAAFDLASVAPIGKAKALLGDLKLTTKGVTKVGEEKLPGLAQKITQGKLEDVPNTIDTLKQIEPKKIKTASDLSSGIRKQVIEPNEVKISSLADNTGMTFQVPLGKTSEAKNAWKSLEYNMGELGSHNYVKDAFDALKTESDIPTKRLVKTLEDKLVQGKFTLNDINTLAKEVGKKWNAYTKAGVMKTSKIANEGEALRDGLKETFRQYLPEEARALDLSTSKAIKTSELMDKFANRVADEIKKAPQTSFLRKAVGGLAGTLDAVTGRVTSTILQQLAKTAPRELTDIELEKLLSSRLKEFQKIVKSGDQTALKKFLKGSGYAATGIIANQVNKPVENQ